MPDQGFADECRWVSGSIHELASTPSRLALQRYTEYSYRTRHRMLSAVCHAGPMFVWQAGAPAQPAC
jgi:hypothetical protein